MAGRIRLLAFAAMAGPFDRPEATELYCRRCREIVRAVAPWRGWKWMKALWWVGVAVVVVLFPVLAADYCVMMPSSIAYVLAGGILHRLSAELPSCSRCSLPLGPSADGSARRGHGR